MAARPEGVYPDGRGGWYFEATVGTDPSTGKRVQGTKRGFRSATEAGKALRELLGQPQQSTRRPASGMTVSELLDLYLDGLDADDRLSQKTGFDYRNSADVYIRPALGDRRVRDVSPEMLPVRQRKLTKRGASKSGKALSANTIRLARAPLAGGFKLALTAGVVATNPMVGTPRPVAKRSIPRHWSPEQARELLTLIDGDRTFPAWAFLLGSGMRPGRWSPSVGRASTSRAAGSESSRLRLDARLRPAPSTRKSRMLAAVERLGDRMDEDFAVLAARLDGARNDGRTDKGALLAGASWPGCALFGQIRCSSPYRSRGRLRRS